MILELRGNMSQIQEQIDTNYSEKVDDLYDDLYRTSRAEALGRIPQSGTEFEELVGATSRFKLNSMKASNDDSGNASKCPHGVYATGMPTGICKSRGPDGLRAVCDEDGWENGDVCFLGFTILGETATFAQKTSDTKMEISAAVFCRSNNDIVHINGEPYRCKLK